MKYRCPYCVDHEINICIHSPATAIDVDGVPLADKEFKEWHRAIIEPELRPEPLPVPEIDASQYKEFTDD